MKARVIKEWEMYGITHKVGEIMNIPLHSPCGLPMISDRDAFLLDNGFIEEIKEPLIKDEKIRKAVKAWAEANDFLNDIEVHSLTAGTRFSNGHYDIDFMGYFNYDLEKNKTYDISELCGEEEE